MRILISMETVQVVKAGNALEISIISKGWRSLKIVIVRKDCKRLSAGKASILLKNRHDRHIAVEILKKMKNIESREMLRYM